MAIKKSELYSSLWQSCDELRGGMDASQYKDYILVLLFVKYVSDKYTGNKNALLDVPKGGSFADMIKVKNDPEIGDKMNKIIAKLAKANDLMGTIDVADFNDADKLGKGQEMVDRLTNLISIFDNPDLDFQSNRAEGDDILGDAYEYLMRHFATESGKSKGQFYTPAEVSRIMAKVININKATSTKQTVYDPTCGSGSLLIKAHNEAPVDITIYGQEMDNATQSMARMNMILHNCPTAVIWQDNTLSSPYFKENGRLKQFDFAVANPPFSNKAWSTGFNPEEDLFKRFEYGIPPQKNGDYAFLLHLITSLNSKGKGAIILPHGVLFRGNKEADIRRNIIKQGYIKGIIGLPANLFYGTGIHACIIVLDKENANARKGIFMIDASKGFMKDGNKNRLRSQDIHKMVDVFNRQLVIPRYSHMIPLSEIESNEFNLNIPRYIDSSDPEDLHDLDAHLNGGIPNRDIDALSDYWSVLPSLRKVLFNNGDRKGYSNAAIETREVKEKILTHAEFKDYSKSVTDIFGKWCKKHSPLLNDLGKKSHAKDVIHIISEDLLKRFTDQPLLDEYDVYQRLMDYWHDIMQDDVYLLVDDGWKEASKPVLILDDKNKKNKSKEKPDLTHGKDKFRTDLIPPALIIEKYFKDDQSAIDELESESSAISQQLEELKEEHSGEEGLLEEATDDNGKISKGNVAKRLKEIKGDADSNDEREVLQAYMDLVENESAANKKIKEATANLNEKVLLKYSKLSIDEIKSLVVDDKWIASLQSEIQSELNRVSQSLASRIKLLAVRYDQTLPELEEEVVTISANVEKHLNQMGLTW